MRVGSSPESTNLQLTRLSNAFHFRGAKTNEKSIFTIDETKFNQDVKL